MSTDGLIAAPGQGMPEQPIGVMDALGTGWRLMLSDFWFFWGTAALAALVAAVAGVVPLGSFVAGPPLAAGVAFVYMRRIDGIPVTAGKVFEGFSQRFGESIVSTLPLLIVMAVLSITTIVAAVLVIVIPLIDLIRNMNPTAGPDLSVLMPKILVFDVISTAAAVPEWLVMMFFAFAPVAVWDHPQAGWEAGRTSIRLAAGHFWSMLGLTVLGWLILMAATIVGSIACCIGVVFTYPFAMGWLMASLVYLYRSWTGQPRVQGLAIEPDV
jgi:hypothetical protein